MGNLTEKELNAINEQLSNEEVLISKFKEYSDNCKDPELKGKYEEIVGQHEKHFNTLLNILN